MTKIEAIIRQQRLGDVQEALETLKLPAMTVSEVRGLGRQKGITQTYRGARYTINMIPRVKIEIVVSDADVEDVVTLIMNAARTGEIGDGKIFLIPVGDSIRIRTGERGDGSLA